MYYSRYLVVLWQRIVAVRLLVKNHSDVELIPAVARIAFLVGICTLS